MRLQMIYYKYGVCCANRDEADISSLNECAERYVAQTRDPLNDPLTGLHPSSGPRSSPRIKLAMLAV